MSDTGTGSKTLAVSHAVALMVGTVVGAGIFRLPSFVAGNTASATEYLLVWVGAGLVSVAGALCYAELSCSHPNTGGELHFLRLAFGRRTSFLYGWARAIVIIPGSIAILAITSADFLGVLGTGNRLQSAVVAGAMIVALTALNYVGIRWSARAQVWLLVLEFVAILGIVVTGLVLGRAGGHAVPAVASASRPASNWGAAMIFALLTFGGWSEAAYISSEVRGKRVNVGYSIVIGLALVLAIYLGLNLAYLAALGHAGIAASSTPATDVLALAIGGNAALVFNLVIILSCLKSINATMVFGARSLYSLSRDHAVFPALDEWHASGNPRKAVLVQGAISLALLAFASAREGALQKLVDFTTPVFWFFVLLVIASVVILRWRHATVERPFRVWFYPVTPVFIFLAICWVLFSSVMYVQSGALLGIAVAASGLVPLLVAERRYERAAAAAAAE